jgi:hypothetical protein
VCGLEKQIGDFKEGKSFDALLVSVRDEVGNPAVWGIQSSSLTRRYRWSCGWSVSCSAGMIETFERFMFKGRLVGGNPSFHAIYDTTIIRFMTPQSSGKNGFCIIRDHI